MNKIIIRVHGGMVKEVYVSKEDDYIVEILSEDICYDSDDEGYEEIMAHRERMEADIGKMKNIFDKYGF